ncbi:MAG: hypothetical protein ACR2NG_07165 [Acidimicrobiia bacterium]
MQNEPAAPDQAPDVAEDPTVAELQVMLSEADAADAPAIAERIAAMLGESLDGKAGADSEASP